LVNDAGESIRARDWRAFFEGFAVVDDLTAEFLSEPAVGPPTRNAPEADNEDLSDR
jgi:hypothetical protein